MNRQDDPNTAQSRPHSFLVSIVAAIIGFSVLYVVSPTAPVYRVPEGEWAWPAAETGPAIHWYGRLMWSLLAGVLCGAIAGVAVAKSRVLRKLAGNAGTQRMLTGVLTLVLAAAVLYLAQAKYKHWIAH